MTRRAALPYAVATTIAVVAAVLVLVLLHGSGDDTSTGSGTGSSGSDSGSFHGAQLTEAQPRPSFELTATDGKPYDFQAKTAGQLTLLYFGYTNCPDVCPLQMATLSSALEKKGMPKPIVVFVTTDPHRDTPAHLRDWLDNFGTDFVGLSGTPAQIHQAEHAAKVDQSFVADQSGLPTETTLSNDYEVGHAAQIIAYTPDDQAHVVYPSGVQREDWEADLPHLLDAFPGKS
jgi:protein SCO1/2